MRTFVIVAAFAANLTAPRPAPSQDLFIGVDLGVSVATLRAERTDALQYRSGLSVGTTLERRLTDVFSLGTGVEWIRKGAEGTLVGFEEPLAVDLRLDYVQIPLLARLSLPGSRAVQPIVFAGPAVAFETGCDVRTDPSELALTLGCEGPQEARATTDWSVLLGAGIAHQIGRATLRLQGRYDLGLTRIDEAPDVQFPDLRNRAFVVTVGVATATGA